MKRESMTGEGHYVHASQEGSILKFGMEFISTDLPRRSLPQAGTACWPFWWTLSFLMALRGFLPSGERDGGRVRTIQSPSPRRPSALIPQAHQILRDEHFI